MTSLKMTVACLKIFGTLCFRKETWVLGEFAIFPKYGTATIIFQALCKIKNYQS